MTDSRFCRNISKEITNHLNKTKECMDLKDWEQIKGIYSGNCHPFSPKERETFSIAFIFNL